ncbi:MAG: hypothetical protein ACON4E_00765 [Flavobacteriales bacterium]
MTGTLVFSGNNTFSRVRIS